MPSPDEHRAYQAFRFIFFALAAKIRSNGSLNYAQTAQQLSNNQDEFRHLISAMFRRADDEVEENLGQAVATTGELVTYLLYLKGKLEAEYQEEDEPYTRLLTEEDVLEVLGRLYELTPDEREALGLPEAGDGIVLLGRSLLLLQTHRGQENYELLLDIYKRAIGLTPQKNEQPLRGLAQVDDLIAETVQESLSYLPSSDSSDNGNDPLSLRNSKIISDLTLKAQREVRRLLARSGNQLSPLTRNTVAVDAYVNQYFQRSFIKSLARAIVDNERLTSQFPVYLKYVSLKPIGPIPFADKTFENLKDERPYPPVMQVSLRTIERQWLESNNLLPVPGDYELMSQESNQVMADFYIKLPKNYQAKVPRVFQRIASEAGKAPQRIDFTLSSTGIGGALSHVIKVINRALLADIPCLSEYFAIAHDITSTQTIIRENVASPVWAHSLVQLCREETVGKAIQRPLTPDFKPYSGFMCGEPMGHANYCGFDFLSAQAQAGLQARLQAIRNAGVLPGIYLEQLCHQVELQLSLQDAWSHLRGYPFSCMAMIGRIREEILSTLPVPNSQANETEDTDSNDASDASANRPDADRSDVIPETDRINRHPPRPLTRTDRYIYFDAYLSIAEALLDEGAYRNAYHYLIALQVLDKFTEQEGAADSSGSGDRPYEIFSGSLLVRYLLCWANYYYLFDNQVERETSDYRSPSRSVDFSSRSMLIQAAWYRLEEARQHIERRLRKYVVINEVSQGTFHPHYYLMARIEILRAKLLLFFPTFVPYRQQYLPTDQSNSYGRTRASVHWGRLYLTEKARLYAAADGNGELYACCAAMQCWMYLMAAYVPDKELVLSVSQSTNPSSQKPFSLGNLMEWAKRMRDHALLSYADIGQQCYYQIKEKSGLPDEADEFGLYSIRKIKPIYETRELDDDHPLQANPEFLVLDMSLLAIDAEKLPKITPNLPIRKIYLFGGNACYLMFARGLYLLCSDEVEEFEDAPLARQPEEWEVKLAKAMRLLNMAWAIAEEGGELQINASDSAQHYDIHRHTNFPDDGNVYTSPDINAMRDLYPRRITEIADWGKVFSAACMVLRIYTSNTENQRSLAADVDKVLNGLHSAYRLNEPLQQLLEDQPRYNGHLAESFRQAQDILRRHRDQALDNPSTSSLKTKRNQLLGELFQSLFE